MPTHKDFATRHRSAGFRLSETLRGPPVQNARAVARPDDDFAADASQPGKMPANATAGVKLSIVLGSGTQIGPDKIALLESIRDAGSISGAARYMGIQYKRAWMLLDSMNRAFKEPLVTSMPARF
jgi:molybdate transport system regulatory protein